IFIRLIFICVLFLSETIKSDLEACRLNRSQDVCQPSSFKKWPFLLGDRVVKDLETAFEGSIFASCREVFHASKAEFVAQVATLAVRKIVWPEGSRPVVTR